MLHDLIKEFYNVVISTVEASHCLLPVSITSILYDPMFTPSYVSQRHMWSDNSGEYYKYLFDDLNKLSAEKNKDPETGMVYICDSSDINEDPSRADYLYYYEWITLSETMVAILYMKPSHHMAYPSRVIFYGPLYQVYVCDDQKDIDVYETNLEARHRFFMDDDDIRRIALRDMLRNSDREQLVGRG